MKNKLFEKDILLSENIDDIDHYIHNAEQIIEWLEENKGIKNLKVDELLEAFSAADCFLEADGEGNSLMAYHRYLRYTSVRPID